MKAPSLIVTLQFDGLDDVVLDIAPSIARLAASNPQRFKQALQGVSLLVADIAQNIPSPQREAAWAGMVSINKNIVDLLNAFAAEAGLIETGPSSTPQEMAQPKARAILNAKALDRHFNDIQLAKSRIDGIVRMVKSAEKGRITEAAEDTGMVSAPFGDQYATDIETLTEDWGYDSFIERDPNPEYGTDAYEAWQQRFQAWQTENMLPFVYGTAPIHFAPLTAEQLLEDYFENDDRSLAAIAEGWIESRLDDHHEDAHDDIVGIDELCAGLQAWETKRRGLEKRLGEGQPADHELHAIVKAFNDKQTLISYTEVATLLVPVRAGVTKEDCVAALQKRHVDALAAYEALVSDGWTPPSPTTAPTTPSQERAA